MRSMLMSLLALGLGSCLYIGGRNRAPEASFPAQTTRLERCAKQTLAVSAADPDGDTLTFRWSVRVISTEPATQGKAFFLTGLKGAACPLAALDDPAVRAADGGADPVWVISGETLELAALPLRGQYHVQVEVRDELGATSIGTTSFRVGNAPPEITELRMEQDPDLRTYSLPDTTGDYPAHGHYKAWIKATDADDDLRCNNTRRELTWEPVGHALEQFEYWQPAPCDLKNNPFGALRFRLRQEAVTAPGEIVIRATIADTDGAKASKEAGQKVVPNRPACIGAVEPAFFDREVILPAGMDNSFRVVFVSNDVPEPLEFTWSIMEGAGQSFVPVAVQLGDGLSTYTFPAQSRSALAALSLRVAVRELTGTDATCTATEPLCVSPGVKLAENRACYRWVTWKVKFL